MRLAHFIQRYPPALGGSESYFARLSRYCAAKGDDVTVFTTNAVALEAFWSPDASCLPAGIAFEGGTEIRRYPLWRMHGRRWLLKPLSLLPHRLWQCLTLPCNPIAWKMWRDASMEPCSFDAVHASAFPYAWTIACAWHLARRLDVPFFLTPFLHVGDPDDRRDRTRRAYTSPALRWLLGQADAVFVQTPSERDVVIGLGLDPSKVVLQGLGVEPAECTGGDRIAARQRWRVAEDAIVVGHLANHSAEKGTNDLLQALTPLWHTEAPIHVVLAGPQMPNFLSFWDSFRRRHVELANRIHIIGPLSDQEKRDFYAGLDIFALPSRSDSFGLVLLEAWANGIPNLAYRAGGIADVIQHGQDGLLVPCGDIPALTLALEQLVRDTELRHRLGAAGQARLPHDFVWEEKLALVRQKYTELARNTPHVKFSRSVLASASGYDKSGGAIHENPAYQ